MPPSLRKPRLLSALAILVLVVGVFLFGKWKEAGDRGGQTAAEPFRIAGNFYSVGANDISAFLITGPQGHVLIDGGYPLTPSLIVASIEQLGFDIKDVRVLLNSEPHGDHAGGLARLQELSGAELWASEASAPVIAAGGDDSDLALPMRVLMRARLISYPPARVDHVFKDGDTIRLGPTTLTAHLTGGHTRGCTSWTFAVRDQDRTLNVVSACSLVRLSFGQYPEQRADFDRTFRVLRALPVDIWVTSHGRLWGRYKKFSERAAAKNPVDPFIDPEGYRAYIDKGEAELRNGIVH